MNTSINKFSPKRMLRYMVADMYNRRTSLILFLALAILGSVVYFLLTKNLIVTTYPGVVEAQTQINLSTRAAIQGMWAVSCLVMLVYTSMIFTPFFKRGYAAQNIMLPASRCEKFTSRILDITVVAAVITGICSLMSLVFIKYSGATIDIFPFYKIYTDINGYPIVESGQITEIISSIISALFSTSIYFFGATLWRKLHFIKTSATLLSIMIAIALWDSFTNDFDITEWFSTQVWNVILVVATLGFVVISWLRFKKIQIKG